MKPGVRARYYTKFKARKKYADAGLYRKKTVENPHFITVEGHDCHPDAIECCGDCLRLNGYDVEVIE